MTEVKQGYCIEDLEVGMTSTFEKVLGDAEVRQFAELTGDNNPIHLNEEFAAGTMFKQRIAHGMLTASLISTILGTQLPGTGVIYMSQSVRFRAPVFIGDKVVASVEVIALDRKRRIATLSCQCHVGDKLVIDGEAKGLVPSREQG
ncbi:MAG TPA: MaoC family dehydratase [Rhizobiales bacterium]|nr:MaoC family dehydratase [Hyphomicrobiales bacterium]